jgi:hypothetical protein
MSLKIKNQVLFAVISFIAVMDLARAEEPKPDKFKLSIGGYALTRYESNISMTDPTLGAGISISPQDTLGIDIESSVLRIEGYYRFSPDRGLAYSWYSIDSPGDKTIEKQFEWVDPGGNTIIIPAGAQATSDHSLDIIKIGYLWSFHHSDKVEMGLGAGLHYTRLELNLNASTTIPANSTLRKVDTTVPLPVLSLVLQYNVTPKFYWFIKSEMFAMKFDNWVGNFRDNSFGMEYRAWKHVALGASLNSSSLDIEEDDPGYQLKFDNSMFGGQLYVATYF